MDRRGVHPEKLDTTCGLLHGKRLRATGTEPFVQRILEQVVRMARPLGGHGGIVGQCVGEVGRLTLVVVAQGFGPYLIPVGVHVGRDKGRVALGDCERHKSPVAARVVGEACGVVSAPDDHTTPLKGLRVFPVGQPHPAVVSPGQEGFQGLKMKYMRLDGEPEGDPSRGEETNDRLSPPLWSQGQEGRAPQHPGTEPVHPGDDATTAELAAYERALAEYGKALDLWEKYLARADGGVDYKPQSYIVQFSPGERKLRAGVALASAAMTTGVGETIKGPPLGCVARGERP